MLQGCCRGCLIVVVLLCATAILPAQFIDFTPAHVPHNSPINYSQYWSGTSYLLQLREAPDWEFGRDFVTEVLFRPLQATPGYSLLCDPLATAQSLYIARAAEGSLQELLTRLTHTVNNEPDGLTIGTFGRLRMFNLFDVWFHVGPNWTPPGETEARPFVSIIFVDPFEPGLLVEHLVGAYPATSARHLMPSWVALHNFGRDHGESVIAISHSHLDHFTHPLFYEGVALADSQALYGPGYEPNILLTDEIAVYLMPYAAQGVALNPNAVHFTEAAPFVRTLPGSADALRIERVSTYQDGDRDGFFSGAPTSPYHTMGWGMGPLVQTPTPFFHGPDILHCGIKVSFPQGPSMMLMGEGTYLDLAAFQTYFPMRPDYVVGTGNHTSAAVGHWILDTANGGANGATYVPSGYHNYHAEPGWVGYPTSEPLAALPGFLQYIEGGP